MIADESQGLMGQLRCVPYTFVPSGWMACEGQVLDAQQHQRLCVLLGSRFGGDGIKTVGLPDLRGKDLAPGLKWIIAINGEFPMPSDE